MSGLFDKPLQITGLYASVAPDRGVDHPDRFTYAVPSDLADVQRGDRVIVPLGRGSTPTEGTVVTIDGECAVPADRVKPIFGRKGTRLPFPLVDLGLWISSYYCCPLGTVFAAMLPAAVKKGTGTTTRTLYGLVSPASLEPRASDLSARAIPGADAASTKLPPATARAWESIRERLDASEFPIEKSELIARVGLASAAPLGRLVKRGLLTVEEQKAIRTSPLEEEAARLDDPTVGLPLTAEQASAVDRVVGTLGTFTPHVLLGVTGSGKTEVYLRVLEAVIARGAYALVLVPEISLTPQTAGRFIARFGLGGSGGVAVLHSGLTASQRHAQWYRVSSGEARIVVGARSAVFAPFPVAAGDSRGGLGVIIVDEEHDGSYKQDQSPRYHARDVAVKRAQLEGCPVVLGSATPSLESYANTVTSAGVAAKYSLVRLTERVGGGRLPRVRIVDLNAERRSRAEDKRRLHVLGPTLEAELRRTLDADEQAILLLNKRGYAGYIASASPASDFVLSCDHCDVRLVYHRHRLPTPGGTHRAAYVKCHHCGAMNTLPEVCPETGATLVLLGFGTQRLEEELQVKFPELIEGDTLLRLDADAMRSARDYHEALERFRTGRGRVLAGTQMIAKGLDFPNVTLVGVVNADTALALPDFRATERTFQLVAQVAGRAGRTAASAERSRVIVQTMDPEHPAITSAAAHDYDGFAESELRVRALARPALPPVGRMARVVFRDRDHAKAMSAGERAAGALKEHGDVRLCWRGPFDAPIARVADHHRVSIELVADGPGPIQIALTALRNRGLIRSGNSMAVDVDPIALL